MSFKKKLVLFLPIFLLCLWVDQWSKAEAIESLKGQMPRFFLDGFFQLIYAENTGAWGSLGSDWPWPLRELFLLYLPIAAILVFLVYLFKTKSFSIWHFTGMSLILSGGIANLIDRVRFSYVVDFMWMGFPKLGTNIFNFADVFIMVGLGLYLIGALIDSRQDKKKKGPSDSEVPT